MHEHWKWLVVPELYRIEWVYLGALILISCLLPRHSSILSFLNGVLHRLAKRRRAAVLTTVLVVLVGRLALMSSLGIPKPAVADEFGYLLTADTFAHGRMSNPTPPLWKSLETIHIFQTPTYQSQYPIGYPAILALAQVVLKNPWWGVYLTTALMCGAITWMLQAWLPPYWALLGGVLAAIRLGLFSYWMNSFWGASLTALGGALVFGALPRLTALVGRRQRSGAGSTLSNGFLLGLGAAILATTRPYEGAAVCLPAAVVFFRWLWRQRVRSLREVLWSAAVPCTVLLVAAAVMLYYQHRVTGHALESPYHVALEQYHVTPAFVFQNPLPMPHYDHLEMRLVYMHFEVATATHLADPVGLLDSFKTRATWYWQFFVAPLMTLPLFSSVMTVRDRKLKFVWLAILLLAIAVLLENWIQVHYVAPGFGLFVLLLLQGTRRLKSIYLGRYALGPRMVRALPLVCVVLLGLRAFAFGERKDTWAEHWPPNWAYSTFRLYNREQIEDDLNGRLGQHLILVRYRYPFHSYFRELVYNGADLASTKILWARSMDAKQNCAFVQTYSGRRLWILDQWGDITKFSSATKEQVCDPLNLIYEPNRPLEYYMKRTGVAPGTDPTTTHAALRHARSDE